MAILISQGSGATLATELINSLHYSQGKIVDGTPGSTNPWKIDSNSAGLVQLNHLTSLASGQKVGLNPSSDFIGLVSAASIQGQVSVVGSVPVTGTFWQATQPVSFAQLVSLASGTEMRSLATILNFPATQAVSFNQLVSLASGTEIRSLATIQNFPTAFGVNSNVTLNPSPNFIGLATVVPSYLANTTLFPQIVSANGNTTLFLPPSNQKFYIKNLQITSLGRSEVEIRSGATMIIPYAALATTGGYVENFGESGLPARQQNDAFVVNLNAAATISVMAHVYFAP